VRVPAPARRSSIIRGCCYGGDATRNTVGEAGPLSPRPVVAATEEVPTPGEPAVALQDLVGPEGATRAASPEIQEAEEGTGVALLQGAASGEA
jgi:hypothetical protein